MSNTSLTRRPRQKVVEMIIGEEPLLEGDPRKDQSKHFDMRNQYNEEGQLPHASEERRWSYERITLLSCKVHKSLRNSFFLLHTATRRRSKSLFREGREATIIQKKGRDHGCLSSGGEDVPKQWIIPTQTIPLQSPNQNKTQ